jgi:transcriptional regulator with XRE-family HTH domain
MANSMLVVQFRMARAALGLGIVEFAELANVSTNTLVRYERGDDLKQSTVDHLQTVLEDAGIIFISENGDGPGIRLKKPALRNE